MRTNLLSFIARLVIRKPWWVIGAVVVLTAASIVIATTKLQMNTDQDDLVSEKLEYHKRYKDYLREFGDLEYLYIVVDVGQDIGRAKEFIKDLAGRIEKLPDVDEVTYQISNPKLDKSFLLYLPKDQIKSIGLMLPKMEKINNLGNAFAMMNDEIAAMKGSSSGASRKELESNFRFLDRLLDGLVSVKDGGKYKSFLTEAFLSGDRAIDEEGYLLSENGKLLFMMIMPKKNYKTLAVIDAPLKEIRSALSESRKVFPDVSAGLTGRPVLAADEMRISDSDMTIATIVALIIVTLIFIAYFRRPTRPIMASVALVCGIVQTFGITTIVVGHLTILSIVFAVILVGAGIEYGLQIVSRYREELEVDRNVQRAITVSIIETGKGNITATLTTAAGFMAACFTNFLALQELGLIAGIGIILCLANMFTMLPAMMYLRDRNKPPEQIHTLLKIKLDCFEFFYNRPGKTLLVTAIITLAMLFGLWKVSFNHNLLELQADGLESVKFEKKILEESSQSTWYVPFIVGNLKEMKTLSEKVKKLPTVGKVETISEAVPDDQKEKIALVRKIKAKNASRVTLQYRPDMKKFAIELSKFKKNIERLQEMAFSSGESDAVAELEKISEKTATVEKIIGGDNENNLLKYEEAFIKDISKQIGLLKSGLNPETVSFSDMPSSIQKRYKSSKSGRYTFYAYPKEDVWDPRKMERFILDIRSVDPEVTGVPVEVYESSKLLENSFKRAAALAMIAIIFIVAVDFRSLKFSTLALMPLTLGVLWLLELMGVLNVKFNLANFFGIPILLGVGVDNAVQIVHRYKLEAKKGNADVNSIMTKSTGVAVLLTSITTLASFCTLVFARHKGIASLGLIMTIGTITCFIGSMIVLPCALKCFKKVSN